MTRRVYVEDLKVDWPSPKPDLFYFQQKAVHHFGSGSWLVGGKALVDVAFIYPPDRIHLALLVLVRGLIIY